MFRRNDKSDAPGPNVYQMKQKMMSIGDDFWIENGAGQRVFKVDGKALQALIRAAVALNQSKSRA